jgi:hypothetical protein
MLDFVISKVAMIMAAVFILLAGIGIYEIQKSAMEEEELQNIADKIAKTVNELSGINANTEVNISSDRYRGGIYIKPTVGNEGYKINITRDIIFITQNGRSIASNFIDTIHLWKPEVKEYNRAEIAYLDQRNKTFEIRSGDDVVIYVERRQIEGSGSRYRTFVYWLPA